jgi:hypothetical protein
VAGDAVNDLDGQGSPACGQLVLGDLVGREQSTLTADEALESGTGALADAEGGEFGVEAGSLLAASLAGAENGPAVEGREIEDETAEEAEGERSCLGLAERTRGRGYFFLAAAARGCWAAAWASREATN